MLNRDARPFLRRVSVPALVLVLGPAFLYAIYTIVR